MKFLFGLTLCVTLAAALPLSSSLGKRAEPGDDATVSRLDFGDETTQNELEEVRTALGRGPANSEVAPNTVFRGSNRTRRLKEDGPVTTEEDGTAGTLALPGLGKRDASVEGMTLQ